MELRRKPYVSFFLLTCFVQMNVKNCLLVQNPTDEISTLSSSTYSKYLYKFGRRREV